MQQPIKRLIILLILLAAVGQAAPARADGGLVVRPYWTFDTKAPVTHIRTGDINGDGVEEVVALADKSVYTLEGDGSLSWRYETGTTANVLLVTDLDGDQTAEIFVGGKNQSILLSDVLGPVWMNNFYGGDTPTTAAFAIDLDGDGRQEILRGWNQGTDILNSETGGFDGDNYLGTSGRPVVDLWAGDVDGDGRPEIVPSPAGSPNVAVWEENSRDQVWQKRLEDGVGLVRGGDFDGDGQAELFVLTTGWNLLLLAGSGDLLWEQPVLSGSQRAPAPGPGQLLLQDLDGDGRPEIIVLATGTVYAFSGAGHRLWQQQLSQIEESGLKPEQTEEATSDGSSALLNGGQSSAVSCQVNHNSQVAVLATIAAQDVTYLLSADGSRLAEYLPGDITGALACADLNNDGQDEIIIGTKTGVQIFGASPRIERAELWRSFALGGPLWSLYLTDLDDDNMDELVAGIGQGRRVYGLTTSGQILWEVTIEAPVQALSAGDVDGDGQNEVVLGTWVGRDAGKIFLIDNGQPVWSVAAGLWVTSIALGAESPPGSSTVTPPAGSRIIAGVNLLDNSNAVLILDRTGREIWRRKFDNPVSAVSSDGQQVLVGTETGQVYRLTANGEQVEHYNLEAKVLRLEANLAATTGGKIYQLAGDTPTLLHDFGETPTAVQLGQMLAGSFEGGRFRVMTGSETVWQGTVADEITSIATGDINGDGEIEIAIGTQVGQVHLFGAALDQPLLLTKPDLNETRTGYTYNVNVNDPEGGAIPITLEIWDPSTGSWLPQSAQFLAEDQAQGRLNWNVTEPFDIWDSGKESRFRFVYQDGNQQRFSPETPGPLTIPTTPWTVYYGQRTGLAALILLVPALGLLLYRRQRAYRNSPVGRAETLLKELKASPAEILRQLQTLARNNSPLLTYLPGLAREAGDVAIADLSEGLNLILVRPEVTAEDLRTIKDAVDRLDGLPDEHKTRMVNLYELYLQALEANTVSRIIALQPSLVDADPSSPPTDDAAVTQSLADLSHVAETMHNYQRVDTVEDQIAYLGQALESLGRLEREFRANLPQPERNIVTQIAANWMRVVTNALQDLQGRAEINVTLKTRQLLNLDQATLSLELTNTGRSPASNVRVNLIPDQLYAVSNGTAQLDILPAGRSAVVELAVSAANSVEQFRAEFNIVFDDRERTDKAFAFADVVHLLKPDTEFRPIPNPYAPGTPLAPDSPIFFGRDDLFQFISENIAGLSRQNILVLIGQRRTGKTSFLQQLPARLGDDYLPVYIDGQSLGIDPGMANFFYDLSLAIVDTLEDEEISIDEPEPEDFKERPSSFFERTFLPRIFAAIGRQPLLLLFDEFEELEMRVASGKLDPSLFSFFRHLMQHDRRLDFIFVGTHRLESLSSDYWSIFFNIARYKHVAFLDENAARALIVEPVVDHGLVYDDLALDKMLRVTAGHPYFLQLTCHALVNRANREQRNYVTIQDVNDVLNEMLELGEAHFAFLWEQAGRPEQLVLAALTRLLGQAPTATTAQVAELLTERGVRLPLPEIGDALRGLVDQDVVRELRGQPPRYQYKVELVRLWVDRYKSLGRVVEEMG